ncbi:MAG: DUF4040 domain-containing protein [Clostridiales bacterium]|nr:DUF4040 domain-containing protein [Clostridiales bacterium]
MTLFNVILIAIMIIGAIASVMVKNILSSVIIFMVYSLMMAIVWQQLNAPDMAITEASVGAGVTTILFVLALRKMRMIKK